MICTECLVRIVDLERLEGIHQAIGKAFRDNSHIPKSQHEDSALAITERDAKLDELICRLELKRHQRRHVKRKPPNQELSYAVPGMESLAG